MESFVKLCPFHSLQISRSLIHQYGNKNFDLRPIYSKVINEIIIRMDFSNKVVCSSKDLQRWAGDKSLAYPKAILKCLENIGFWTKIKRGQYMINPSVLNNQKNEHFQKLFSIYHSYGGKQIVFDPYVKSIKDSKLYNRDQKTIEIALEKFYEESVHVSQEREKKMLYAEIEDLKNEIHDLKALMKSLHDKLTPEQKQQLPERHLRIVTDKD